MDLVYLHFDGNGVCEFENPSQISLHLSPPQIRFFSSVLTRTCTLIREFSQDVYARLIERRIQIRLCEDLHYEVTLTPHELLVSLDLLSFDPKEQVRHTQFFIGLLEQALFRLCHPTWHVSRILHHHVQFLAVHPRICEAMIKTWGGAKEHPGAKQWLEILPHVEWIIVVERFWAWLGQQAQIEKILAAKRTDRRRELVSRACQMYLREERLKRDVCERLLKFKTMRTDTDALVVHYKLGRNTQKVIRIGASEQMDAMASEAASHSVWHGQVRTDVFYDHGAYIEPWFERLKLYRKVPGFHTLSRDLLSSDIHTVHAAVDTLVQQLEDKLHVPESLRLLYATLYYWSNPSKGVCRGVCLRINKILEDYLTERPLGWPSTRVNRTVFRGEAVTLRIQVTKPHRIKRESMQVRVRWVLNGNKKRTVHLELDQQASRAQVLVFSGEFPTRKGWIHYATEVSQDGGGSWNFEALDPNAQGLIKYIADERGERVLSFYADTFNLKLDHHHRPQRDGQGAYVYGDFETLASQLESIKEEGYTRLYPLGALELGWAGEAGPDPSVFSVFDGKSVRRDLGGLSKLLKLRDEADRLGMKIILCVVSHFARAFTDYPYHLPVYIQTSDGRLSRRAGWDGEWDEWLDSFMVNMRDFDNVAYLARIGTELTSMGFGLRIDVGHGFDTVFPCAHGESDMTRLIGEVCVPGFDPVDLRGSWQANISLLYLCYRAQKKSPQTPVIYAEQWHGNEVRMLHSGATPYNSLIKNLEHIRAGAPVFGEMSLNDNLLYMNQLLHAFGGQTISLFNSHDEESPTSNYQNMIWPTAAFLVFSSYGPVMYHISRLPGNDDTPFRERFDRAYLECWKHWVNNRFSHPWAGEENARQELIHRYPMLTGFGKYLRHLFTFATEHNTLVKGALTPICTHHARIAAFVRSDGRQVFLCVFNFPDTDAGGEQYAVPREFNFALKRAGSQHPITEIHADYFYEVVERYNNVEGKRRRGQKECWSGEELLHLGFGGVLAPVSSHVFELINRCHEIDEHRVMQDSFLRYFRYGKQDRVNHTYIALAFKQACSYKEGPFKRFFALFVPIVTWIQKKRKMGIAELSLLLAEISEGDADMRRRIIEYLTRISVHRQKDTGNLIREAAADILHSLNIGTLVMVSPESRFSGSSGGVGLYTTDIADVLSEMGFHVVIVTPLYEHNREQIFQQFGPKFEGKHCKVRFPWFNEDTQSIEEEGEVDVVNFLRTKLNRFTHGKRSRVEVVYLENSKYFDQPYSGAIAEDKLRRARLFAVATLEALRSYNYYPAIIQTNEWPTWLLPAYLTRSHDFRDDPHFTRTRTFSMMHNPHPSYSIVLKETNPRKACYYARVVDFDPVADFNLVFNPESRLDYVIDLTHIMLQTSPYIGTVSNAMRQRILDEPWLFGHADLFQQKAEQERFFSRRNGFNMAARQRFWFGSKKSILETYSRPARRRLFLRYHKIKLQAKHLLQEDPRIRLRPDDDTHDYVVFGMLHRISRQKGFELLVDWKVYLQDGGGTPLVQYEPWNMEGMTVLEYFLSTDERIQFVICGRVEDSFDGRRFHMHLDRLSHHPFYRDRFGYYPEGSLPPSLYRNLYLGCQYFVMPSGGEVGEPCGISQQEAHAGGTPVIAHHQDGLKKTVCDRDFGDLGCPSNGIKFTDFSGRSLLAAMMDAVEIYYEGQRSRYRDSHGRPRPLRYEDLVFNALSTDHRWLYLLRDYVRMYAHMLGEELPSYLDAVQLIVDINDAEQKTPGDAILKRGMEVPQALEQLKKALTAPVASVRFAAAKALNKMRDADEAQRKGNGNSGASR